MSVFYHFAWNITNPVWFGKDNNYSLLPNGLYFIEIKVKNESRIIMVEINR
jgi:hypothetical protein